ncbi:MAG TPA: hypothetical protein VFA20_05515 [Myxococcaceae bacterium]|nr:hypothetical protein [Myxococcaceae bacterium]
MNLDLQYLGYSGVVDAGGGEAAVSFAPNLARERVSFDAALKDPVRYREAMSALHEVVVGDLRFRRRDKSAYEAWKADQQKLEAQVRAEAFKRAKDDELKKLGKDAPPPNLEADFRRMHQLYWKHRVDWANELGRNDPELFRHLVPCDPVVTVAPDTVFFECFAKDESSYGCLFVDRDAFQGGAQGAALGTTNVDYSIALFDHFQTLRTYRPTRLLVDPKGFEVKVQGAADLREEKIDLPPSWLRGFGQLQAAMALPSRRVELGVEAVYSILAWLKRHREKTGPRSIRFQLTPGQPPLLVLEPWGVEIQSRGPAYQGEKPEAIKVWGRRRLMALARLLPMAEGFSVQLLGSGLPSVWVARMGPMRMVLALSGWTANDWSSGAALEMLAGDLREDLRSIDALARHLQAEQRATLAQLAQVVPEQPREVVLGSLHRLAKQGQLVFDFAAGVYRWRQAMPFALAGSVLGPESPEVVEGQKLARSGAVKPDHEEILAGARRYVFATVGKIECEGILDPDGGFTKGKCTCTFFRANGLRKGPCRHLLAMRLTFNRTNEPPGPSGLLH